MLRVAALAAVTDRLLSKAAEVLDTAPVTSCTLAFRVEVTWVTSIWVELVVWALAAPARARASTAIETDANFMRRTSNRAAER